MRYVNNEKGAALVMVIVIGVIVAIISMVTIMSVKNSASKVSNRRAIVSAFNMAEAGKEHALAGIRARTLTPIADEKITIITRTAFDRGHYTVLCSSNTDLTSIRLISTGELKAQSKTIEVTCDLVMYEEIDAFNYLILTDGEFKHENNGDINLGIGGKAHTNDEAKFEGVFNLTGDFSSSVKLRFSLCNLYGNATAPIIEVDTATLIDGNQNVEAVPEIEIPVIDWAPYRARAIDSSEFISGDYIISSIGILEPTGGIIWVDGNVKFEASSGGTLVGCIIATGWILFECENTLTQTKVDNLPAFVSTTSSVKKEVQIVGINVEGLIYAETDILLENNGSLEGAVMCKGECAIENDWNLTYKKSIPSLETGDLEVNICTVVTWREL